MFRESGANGSESAGVGTVVCSGVCAVCLPRKAGLYLALRRWGRLSGWAVIGDR